MLYQLNYLPTCPKTKVITFLSFYNARIYWKIINSQGIVSSMTEICHEIFLAWQFGLCECKFFIPILISNINSHIGHDTAHSKYIHIFLYMLMGYTIVIHFKKMKEFNSLSLSHESDEHLSLWWPNSIPNSHLMTGMCIKQGGLLNSVPGCLPGLLHCLFIHLFIFQNLYLIPFPISWFGPVWAIHMAAESICEVYFSNLTSSRSSLLALVWHIVWSKKILSPLIKQQKFLS